MKPQFFSGPDEFRRWLGKHHLSVHVLWVGFHKKSTGKPSITWPESVDQALCFGWIDGVRKSLSAKAYAIRFTPRKSRSIWSAVNIRRARQLIRLGLMRPAGQNAFAARDDRRSRLYSFERARVKLSVGHRKLFQSSPRAWEFFQSQPPGYRKTASWWVVSAKQESTRERRLRTLITDSKAGRRIAILGRVSSKA